MILNQSVLTLLQHRLYHYCIEPIEIQLPAFHVQDWLSGSEVTFLLPLKKSPWGETPQPSSRRIKDDVSVSPAVNPPFIFAPFSGFLVCRLCCRHYCGASFLHVTSIFTPSGARAAVSRSGKTALPRAPLLSVNPGKCSARPFVRCSRPLAHITHREL